MSWDYLCLGAGHACDSLRHHALIFLHVVSMGLSPFIPLLPRSKFYEWLAASGNLRQVLDLIQLEREKGLSARDEKECEGGVEDGEEDMMVAGQMEGVEEGREGGRASPVPLSHGLIGRFVAAHEQHVSAHPHTPFEHPRPSSS